MRGSLFDIAMWMGATVSSVLTELAGPLPKLDAIPAAELRRISARGRKRELATNDLEPVVAPVKAVMPWTERDAMDQRLQFVTDALRDRVFMTELCARYGVSRRIGDEWLARLHQERHPEGSVPRSRFRDHLTRIGTVVVEPPVTLCAISE